MKMKYSQLVCLLFSELREINLEGNLIFVDLKDFISIDFENKHAIIQLPFSGNKDKPIIIQLEKTSEENK